MSHLVLKKSFTCQTKPKKLELTYMDKIVIPDRKGLREFGIVTGVILAVLFGVLFPWLFTHHYPLWPWFIAGLLIMWALVLPQSLKPVYQGWMFIGMALGWVNSRLILTIMFYFIIMPIGLLMRLLGKNPLQTQQTVADSYRKPSSSRSPKHMERPF